MYHMWRMMQVGTSNCVPHMAHDAVKVLENTYMLAAVKTNYEGNCQDNRHKAHGGKYLSTGRFAFFKFIFNSLFY